MTTISVHRQTHDRTAPTRSPRTSQAPRPQVAAPVASPRPGVAPAVDAPVSTPRRRGRVAQWLRRLAEASIHSSITLTGQVPGVISLPQVAPDATRPSDEGRGR